MKTKEEVLVLLADLGTTADEVAQKLVSLGIKGNRRHCRYCPIAHYLVDNGLTFDSKVGLGQRLGIDLQERVIVVNRYWYAISNCPQLTGVRDFIFAFDRGEYPQCEKEMSQ